MIIWAFSQTTWSNSIWITWYIFTHYATLYPQNGERIVAIDSVTSIHPMYTRLRLLEFYFFQPTSVCLLNLSKPGYATGRLQTFLLRSSVSSLWRQLARCSAVLRETTSRSNCCCNCASLATMTSLHGRSSLDDIASSHSTWYRRHSVMRNL